MSTPQERGWPEWRCAEPLDVVRITAPHFVTGIVPFRGMVVSAAPILRFMCGWSGREVSAYCKRKGWTWERLTQRADAPFEYEQGAGVATGEQVRSEAEPVPCPPPPLVSA